VRLGLIARADSRGLGIQCLGVARNLNPTKVMVVDCPSAKPLPIRRDWYPDAQWVHGLPTPQDFERFCDGLSVVYTAETSYGQSFWNIAEHAGVKTVLAANYEFLDLQDRPSLWAMPSMWHFDEVPFPNKTFLPVPIDTSVFSADFPAAAATNFLHVCGRPAIHDRNGSLDLLLALQHVTSTVTVTMTCQEPGYISGLIAQHGIRTPPNVTLVVKPGDVENYWDLYAGQHVLVMPRRFGGLALPVNEALGAGMPVIMPAISPNDSWLPQEWLTPARWVRDFYAKTRVDVYETDPQVLAAKIDEFASDPDQYAKARAKAYELRTELSWTALKPLYLEVLGNV
jgi:glycosyltransferase involved in cell wall biosynthesis